MKKLFNISLLLLLGTSVLNTSCVKSEEDDIFDKGAAERLEEAKLKYSKLLVDEGGKWAMEYVANEEEPGYVYLMTFKSDGSVIISGDNKWITKLSDPSSREATFATETSMWEVIADNGPVLTFNTYNNIFHLFANPEDVPNETSDDPDETGYGHDGDYEFDLMRYSGDTLYLEGKKHEMPIIMYRIPADTDDKAYFDKIDAMLESVRLTVFPDLLLRGSNGKEYYVNNLNTQVVDFYRHDPNDTTLKKVDTVVTGNCIATATGFRFINPVWLIDDLAQTKTLWVEHFAVQEDGSLLCTDDGVSRITSLPLDEVFNCVLRPNTTMNWVLDPDAYGGKFVDIYKRVVDGCKQEFKRNFSYFRLYYVSKRDCYVLGFRDQNSNGEFDMLSLTITGENNFKFVYDKPADAATQTHLTRVPAFQDFIDLFCSTSYTVTSPSALNPVRMKFTSDANPEDYFYVYIATKRP